MGKVKTQQRLIDNLEEEFVKVCISFENPLLSFDFLSIIESLIQHCLDLDSILVLLYSTQILYKIQTLVSWVVYVEDFD